MFLGCPRRGRVADDSAVIAEGERRLGLQTSEAHVQPQLQRAPFPRRQRLLHAVADDGPHLRHGQFAAVLVDQIPVALQHLRAADDAVRRYEAERNKDPEYRLKQAGQELAKLARPQIGVSSQEDVEKYRAAEQRVEQLKALIEHTQKLREEETRLEAFEKQMYQKDMDPVARIFAERDELVKSGADWNRATAAALYGADVVLKKQEEEQSKRWQELTMKAAADSEKFWDKQWEEVYKEATARGKQVFENLKQQVTQVRAELAWSDEQTFARMTSSAVGSRVFRCARITSSIRRESSES